MSVLTAESRREIEIHRYPVLIYALVPVGRWCCRRGCRGCWVGLHGSICRWW